jgi:hypothetical protein
MVADENQVQGGACVASFPPIHDSLLNISVKTQIDHSEQTPSLTVLDPELLFADEYSFGFEPFPLPASLWLPLCPQHASPAALAHWWTAHAHAHAQQQAQGDPDTCTSLLPSMKVTWAEYVDTPSLCPVIINISSDSPF